MNAMRAIDLMIPIAEYPSLNHRATLKDALHEFEKHQFDIKGKKSLPRMILVFDEEKTLVGVLRRRDILRGLEPESLRSKPHKIRKMLFDVEIDPNLSELSYDRMIADIRVHAERPVTDVMRPTPGIVYADDNILKVIYEFVTYNTSLLPVCSGSPCAGDKKIIGVVRTVDVTMEFHKILFGD